MTQMLVVRKMTPTPEPDPGNHVPAAAVAVAPMARYPEGLHLAVGLAIFVLGILLAVSIFPSLFPAHSVTFTPADGVSAFALFFLAATVVERAIEPFASGLVRASPQWSTGTSGSARGAGSQRAGGASGPLAALGKTKAEALTMRSSLIARVVDGTTADAGEDMTRAAAEQATADQAVVNATFVLWAVATLVATPIVFYFGLSLPKALGVTAGTNLQVDQVLTAIMVGSGTKPLHDIFSTVQKSGQGGKSPGAGGDETDR
jgi:hypothetical protein